LLVRNPFLGWQEPAEFIRSARCVAGSRPMLALSDRDSVAERLLALRDGADDAA
jgi:two-component system OmpR family response regulator